MMCHRCLRAAASNARLSLRPLQSLPSDRTRSFATTLVHREAAAATVATSNEPATTVISPPATAVTKAAKPASHMVMSSVPAGTPLKGLNLLKTKTDPVAMEDWEYPAWLWEVLKSSKGESEEGGGDLFSKSKKQRRLAAKRLRKQALNDPDSLVKKVPIQEQSIDLPSGNGTVEGAIEAVHARDNLTKAMRDKRRATIKEANFLKAMG